MELREVGRVISEDERAVNLLFRPDMWPTMLHLTELKAEILLQIIYPLWMKLQPNDQLVSVRVRWGKKNEKSPKVNAKGPRMEAIAILLFHWREDVGGAREPQQMRVLVEYCCGEFHRALTIGGPNGTDQRVFVSKGLHLHG